MFLLIIIIIITNTNLWWLSKEAEAEVDEELMTPLLSSL